MADFGKFIKSNKYIRKFSIEFFRETRQFDYSYRTYPLQV